MECYWAWVPLEQPSNQARQSGVSAPLHGAGAGVDRAHHPTHGPGLHLGLAILGHTNEHNFTQLRTEVLIQEKHLNSKAITCRADELTLTLHPIAQIL